MCPPHAARSGRARKRKALMYIDDSLLTYEEDLSIRLRSLYRDNGFTRFRMGKFEEYDLYAQFRDFLASENIISFTGQNSFLDHFRELLAPLLQEMLRDFHKDSEAMEFHINFHSDAILAALVRWLNDPKRVPPETLVRLLQSCIRVSAEYLGTDFARIP